MSSTDVTTRDEGRDLVLPGDQEYAMMSYDELMAMESFRVAGLSLLSKEELLGVPHIITKVTYWMPKAEQLGMVSCEATLASPEYLKKAIERGWIPNISTPDQMKLEPSERVVYNDGGTGIRRQLTALFHNQEVIDVGHEDVEDDSRFDVAWPEWVSFSETRRQSAEVGDVPCVSRIGKRPLILRADRGLSVSEYSNAYTDNGTTFYLR